MDFNEIPMKFEEFSGNSDESFPLPTVNPGVPVVTMYYCRNFFDGGRNLDHLEVGFGSAPYSLRHKEAGATLAACYDAVRRHGEVPILARDVSSGPNVEA